MVLFDAKIKALESFKPEREVMLAVRRNEEEILAMNTRDQLYSHGIESTGKPIRPKYRPFTVYVKRGKGQPTNRVTLKDTGQFHEDFTIAYGPGKFTILSTNEKRAKLVKKYGKDIFGLTNINLGKLTKKIIRPYLIQKLRETI